MARRPRLAVAGELHHLMLRGHQGYAVFADDADRAGFVDFLRDGVLRHAVAVHGYALLADEVHLLATPAQAESLARLVQSVGRRYVAACNRRHGRRGTLWDGRFRSSVIDAHTLLVDAMLFIESLAVSQGLATAALDWPWSSAPHHCGRWRDPLVTDHPVYWKLGNTPFDRELAHTLLLEEAQQQPADPRFVGAVLGAQVLGPPAFVARVAKALNRCVTPRPRGRPRSNSKKTVPN